MTHDPHYATDDVESMFLVISHLFTSLKAYQEETAFLFQSLNMLRL